MSSRSDDEELLENDRRDGERRRLPLDKEIALKYDPAELSRLVLRDAGRGEPLDAHTRSRMERQLGGDFSKVRVYRGPLAEDINRRYRSDAVTVGGTDMVLVRESPRSNFQSAAGQGLLAHELTHVRQQQRGLHFSAPGSPQQSALEEEADVEGRRAEAEAQGQEQGQAQAEQRRAMRLRFLRKAMDKVLERVEQGEQEEGRRGGHAR